MKKIFFIAFLFLSAISFAQGKFIEVEVRDTITLNPVSFRYNIYINDESSIFADNEEVSEEMLVEKEQLKNKKEELRSILQNGKYTFTDIEDSNMEINAMSLMSFGKGGEGFSVVASNLEELRKLKKSVSRIENVATSIKVLKYDSEQKAEEILVKRLIEKAKAKAAIIGQSSGLKVGRIVEVKEGEGNNLFSGLKELYEETAKFGKTDNDNPGYKGRMSKTFVVKFAAE